jgi:hypothetical protein
LEADVPDHPYRNYPNRAYWSRSVAHDFDPAAVPTADVPLLRQDDRVASMGSCFASNLVPHIERAGFEYVRTEQPHPQLADLPERLGYRDFSAAYGNLYTVRQMLQLLQRSRGAFTPTEDRWHESGIVIDPFRPGLAYPAVDDVEFDAITRSHLDATRQVFREADVLVLTLGLTEAWESAIDGAVFPACPGAVAGTFDAGRHRFRNFTVAETVRDLHELVAEIRAVKSGVRFILTVSPVPLVATASGRHVLEATTYSKSVLRVAAADAADDIEGVVYFPAYEIVTGPQAPEDFFEADRRSVSQGAIAAVMQAFLASCESSGGKSVSAGQTDGTRDGDATALLSRRIAEAECEEEMLDVAG